ncbi:MAG: hybrid sensor histidine kinase/response regulator [Methanospirillum sp.]|uniref:hybrid sensor histidine kinase/response regulator n=1 Tax=Methanospirillum sp. TaxID=45200 RepID=UPI002373C769|nr:hybrid sensor histidine kinase/response regulator [Methanospirillum sp.]MDD1730213.1 hybrid sensor histidine kinase/response regulator [Methanospirillum sp.]
MDDGSAALLNKILIVEDNRTQAEYLRYILLKEGYEITLASNGVDALEVMTGNLPDLVLTDILMPEMDGYTLCNTIKKSEQFSAVPVILVTNLYDPVDVIKGLESGADNFIIKPFDPSRINYTILDTYRTRTQSDSVQQSLLQDVWFAGGTHQISANRRQILNILLSTYEIAVKNYSELQETHDQLNYLNEELQHTVQELQSSNLELISENTERKRVEAALANANNKLQLMASITRHDMLNQLNSLQGYLDLGLSDRVENPDQAWEYILKARMIVSQTIDTVCFTDEYQRIGIKSPIWQDIRMLVEHSLRHTSLHKIRFECDIPPGFRIFADPLIEKVFSNLIENSVKYGISNTYIRFGIEEHEDRVLIICEDDGVGVPAEEKEKIFTFQYGKNTGLGLFLSREILSITGISIREAGIMGSGARFEIICPAGTAGAETNLQNAGSEELESSPAP